MKYHNKKVKIGELTFDSKLEYQRWLELKALESHYKISSLQRQVIFPLIKKSCYGREIRYIADFTYYVDGKLVVEDVKSKATKTQVYKLKKRMVAEQYGIKIFEYEGRG